MSTAWHEVIIPGLVTVRQLTGEAYVVVFSHQGVWLAYGCLDERKQPVYMECSISRPVRHKSQYLD
jgi:hypothetical protein